MVRVSSPAKLRPWSELAAQNGDGGGSRVGENCHCDPSFISFLVGPHGKETPCLTQTQVISIMNVHGLPSKSAL